MQVPWDVGAFVKAEVGIVPQVDTGGAAINGSAIDVADYASCVLVVSNGAATGSPTSYTLTGKLQESADGSTGWADITGAAITTITADNSVEEIDVNLRGLATTAPAKQYIRAVVEVTFTGGTTPDIGVQAMVVLGGARELPV